MRKLLLTVPSVTQIKLPSPSESLLRTDSLSSTEPVLSDGSVGSAPSLGLSPRSCATTDISRNELNQVKDKMMKHQQKAGEVKNTHEKLHRKLWQ